MLYVVKICASKVAYLEGTEDIDYHQQIVSQWRTIYFENRLYNSEIITDLEEILAKC